MRKTALSLLLAVSMVPLMAQAETIRFGIDGNYPPFAKQAADGHLEGFDVDIALSLCEAMKATCEIVPQEWDGLIPALNAGKFDAILSSMQITDERKRAVDFTNRYYQTPSRMVTKSGVVKVTKDDFSGKRIGVLRASTEERYAKDHWGKKGVQIVNYGKVTEAFLDLKTERLDGVFVDQVVADSEFLKRGGTPAYAFAGPGISDTRYFGYGAGIAVKKGNNALRERLNKAIETIRSNGVYQKVQKKYFNFDIYGS
ncbi:transporter substrate-binding domain-containing protein [Pseudogulbenkiania ferrooxidans]|uniref:Extracellular solute-binding protein family 3 n=1 Tax=Pseudogulbenkiania ferrooxidans 2002 TaxID=279714 RepID=B9Z104_9NEIS|nr:transporter substrate-binding domain-containing protein [Pseudogulbenkiania ferrooxidans]EEG09099.1 extracellular solute-binding protein family 3 [Pseudogulbenkiania ferrooxidans 2002]